MSFIYICASMDINAYIASGILEAYSMGKLTQGERAEVEANAAAYPAIRTELDAINDSIEFYAVENSIAPGASVKTKLLLKIYEQQSGEGKAYPPLVTENTLAKDFENWLAGIKIHLPPEPFDNIASFDLPSTDTVINFLVWAKKGHEEEVHDEYNEFIVILKGHCDMYFNGIKTHYDTGEIIVIPPDIPHYAVVTSDEPMFAVVQRQLLAA